LARKTLPPPTDRELYLAEQVQLRKDADVVAETEGEDELERLATAGDPEAMAALQAGASMLSSREIEPEPPKRVKPPPAPKPEKIKEREIPDDKDAAFRLMDVMFRKWKRAAEKDPRQANRDLARDLGGDTAIFLKAGIVRLGDQLDLIIKLTALAKPKDDDGDKDMNFDEEMETLRAWLRGEK
jgi:hypothetical protein